MKTIFTTLFEISPDPSFAPAPDEFIGGFGFADFQNARRDTYITVDVRAGIEGDRWAVTAFAKNVFEEEFLEEVIPAPEFGGAFDHPGARRRYGIELSYNF